MIASTTLYRCLDKLTAHKQEFFSFLRARWTTLFNARFDILLYDLTSTYFESDPPFEDKRQFGHSRDKRRDCVQVVIALVVTPDGFPLAYEVMVATPRTTPRWRTFSQRLRTSTGVQTGCGSWTAGFRPSRHWRRCARAIRRCVIWWARPRAG